MLFDRDGIAINMSIQHAIGKGFQFLIHIDHWINACTVASK